MVIKSIKCLLLGINNKYICIYLSSRLLLCMKVNDIELSSDIELSDQANAGIFNNVP